MKALSLALALLAPLLSLDASIQAAVQAGRRPALEGPMRAATAIGKPWIVGSALVAIALLDPARGPRTALVAALALIPANLATEGLKRATFRARPDGERKRSNSSFPSSHAANAFALALVFVRRWRRAGIACLALAALVAFSRVYLNRHFASDVLAGAAIGLASAWLAERWMGAREARKAAIAGNSGG